MPMPTSSNKQMHSCINLPLQNSRRILWWYQLCIASRYDCQDMGTDILSARGFISPGTYQDCPDKEFERPHRSWRSASIMEHELHEKEFFMRKRWRKRRKPMTKQSANRGLEWWNWLGVVTNLRERNKTYAAHRKWNIRQANQHLGSWRLEDC